jgi:hypothetical protein
MNWNPLLLELSGLVASELELISLPAVSLELVGVPLASLLSGLSVLHCSVSQDGTPYMGASVVVSSQLAQKKAVSASAILFQCL